MWNLADRPVDGPDRGHLVGRQEVERQQGLRGRGEAWPKRLATDDENQTLTEEMISKN
jgi:hypothetical protein